jgi:hypothetical protein
MFIKCIQIFNEGRKNVLKFSPWTSSSGRTPAAQLKKIINIFLVRARLQQAG